MTVRETIPIINAKHQGFRLPVQQTFPVQQKMSPITNFGAGGGVPARSTSAAHGSGSVFSTIGSSGLGSDVDDFCGLSWAFSKVLRGDV